MIFTICRKFCVNLREHVLLSIFLLGIWLPEHLIWNKNAKIVFCGERKGWWDWHGTWRQWFQSISDELFKCLTFESFNIWLQEIYYMLKLSWKYSSFFSGIWSARYIKDPICASIYWMPRTLKNILGFHVPLGTAIMFIKTIMTNSFVFT